jgi:hypothetical protein
MLARRRAPGHGVLAVAVAAGYSTGHIRTSALAPGRSRRRATHQAEGVCTQAPLPLVQGIRRRS